MDLRDFFEAHQRSGADVSIATTAVSRKDASNLGIMKVDYKNQIKAFLEKPALDLDINDWKIPPETKKEIPEDKEYLASMGIYIFNANILDEVLDNDFKDFGKEVIPDILSKKNVYSYIFDGYWEDIGTISSFYKANIQLTNIHPQFNFYDEDEPIYTHMRNLPPSKINKAEINASLTSEGCVITECNLNNSIIGVRSVIDRGTSLDGVIMMGADFYENIESREYNKEHNIPNIGIGKNCKISKTIIDKNAHIGDNVQINVNGNSYEDGDHGNFYCADGIIVIKKGAIVPSGTII
jgi:glucose-1-phosphate adenylyltransferase